MPLHFAAARCAVRSPIARVLARKAPARAANDNGGIPGKASPIGAFDPAIKAALHHFAEHGLGAVEAARRNAEQAHADGDRRGYTQWLGLCRTLDSRAAARIERNLDPSASLIW